MVRVADISAVSWEKLDAVLAAILLYLRQCMLESLLPSSVYTAHALLAKLHVFESNHSLTHREVCCEYYLREKTI